ncbi:MAG: hypothetical protein LBT49_02225 [Prevotellaceae bacterium]|jgi:hypothetical protein|nr:hypothetical protein [Prevotellaceae bacterium]
MKCVFLLPVLFAGIACSAPPPEQSRWYKGDLHAHYLSPDGTATCACVAGWYARKGYGFVGIDTACRLADSTGSCLLLPVSECVDENGVWTTAVNITSRIWTATALREEVRRGNTSPNILTYIPQGAGDLASHHLRNIHRAGGVAVLSRGTLSRLTPEAAANIEDLRLIEIFDGDSLAEAPWDSLLTRRKTVFAVASDTSPAGRGWIMLQAASLTPSCVMKALEQGDFYASSGVMLAGMMQQENYFALEVDTAATRKQLPASLQKGHTTDTSRYEITFITAEGKTAKRTTGLRGNYASKFGDGYVRVRVTYTLSDSLAYHAWTQPRILTF